jgi:hypothetical protein
MKKYQSPDERELEPDSTARLFSDAGFETRVAMYDFVSSPLAGLFPGWRTGYRASRLLDEAILRVPALQKMGSNFEVIARIVPQHTRGVTIKSVENCS